jgi:hypothetical protein
MSSYIPSQDAALKAWAENFDALITANPATYGLVPADAVSIDGFVDAFSAAYLVITNPATKTKPAVANKDGAKAAMLSIVRGYAQQIKLNQGVTNENKLALGLTLSDGTPTPIPAPSSNPILSVIGATMGQQTIRFADVNTPALRAKPFGAIGLQLFRHIGIAPISDPALATFNAFVTRQPYGVSFDNADNGKTCTYFARWQTRTGLVGPWSPPVSFTVAA